jgi:hypothetical protein
MSNIGILEAFLESVQWPGDFDGSSLPGDPDGRGRHKLRAFKHLAANRIIKGHLFLRALWSNALPEAVPKVTPPAVVSKITPPAEPFSRPLPAE